MPIWTIEGRLVSGSHRDFGALRVEGRAGETLVGTAEPNADGVFTLTTTLAEGVSFRVLEGGRLILDSAGTITWSPALRSAQIVLRLSPPEADCAAPPPRMTAKVVVEGFIFGPAGEPVAGAPVVAQRVGLRRASSLGKAESGPDGHYCITFESLGPVPLQVRAGTRAAVAQSRVEPRAWGHLRLDAVMLGKGEAYRGPTELETLEGDVGGLLGDVLAADLTDEEVGHLAALSGAPLDRVSRLRQSHVLARDARLPPAAAYEILRSPAGGTSPEEAAERVGVAAAEGRLAGAAVDIDGVGAAWRDLTVRLALEPADPSRTLALGPLLTAAGVPRTTQEGVLAAFAGSDAPPAALWKALEGTVGSEAVATVQRGLQLGALARGHAPLVAALTARYRGDLVGLAGLTGEEWRKLVAEAGVPAAVPGSSDEERRETYAATLEHTVEESFPDAALGHRLARSELSAADRDAGRFLLANPNLKLSRDRVAEFVARADASFEGVEDRASLVPMLSTMQRLARITSRPAEVLALRAAGFSSASAIVATGRANFVDQLRSFGPERAEIVYGNASQATAAAQMLYARFAPAFQTGPVHVLTALAQPEVDAALARAGLPTYASLFGSTDFCACKDCRSIHGPAAYLVDLLNFLTPAAYAVLVKRRPDIPETALSCANTNTALPYIDLVNEALEAQVIARSGPWPQTTWSEEDLLVAPEHSHAAAYAVLADETHPWGLPFDVAREEADLLLGALGTPRAELMEALQRPGPAPTAAEIAAARLGMNTREWRLASGQEGDPLHLWGYAPATPVAPVPGAPPAPVPPPLPSQPEVDDFLARGGFAYEHLLDLLRATSVNPDGPSRATVTFLPSRPCDVSQAVMTGALVPLLDRIHRFERLRRKLGWSVDDLDIVLQALGTGLVPDALVAISNLRALQERFACTPRQLAALLGHLSVTAKPDETSAYARVFQNPATVPEAERLAFAPRPTMDEAVGLLRDHAASIASAIGVSSADAALMIDEATARAVLSTGRLVASDGLSRANLGRLYAAATLARLLGISVRDLMAMKALTGIDPFTGDRARHLRDLVSAVDLVRKSPLRIEELDELLRGVPAGRPVGRVSPTAVLGLLRDLQSGLQKLVQDHAAGPDETGERTQKVLAEALGPETPGPVLERVMAVLGDAPALELGPAERATALTTALATMFTNAPTRAAALLGLPAGPRRYEATLAALLAALLSRRSEAFVVQKLATTLKLEEHSVRTLLADVFASPGGAAGRHALEDFVDGTLARDPRLEDRDPRTRALGSTVLRLGRVAVLLERLGVGRDALTFRLAGAGAPILAGKDPRFGLLDLDGLPVAPRAQAQIGFAGFRGLLGLGTLRDDGGASYGDILGVLAAGVGVPAPAREEWLRELATVAGWNAQDLSVLAGPSGLGLTSPGELIGGDTLLRLARAMRLLAGLKTRASEALSWIKADVAPGAVDSMRAALRSTSGDDGFREKVRPLQDRLRERKRDALVAFLTTRKHDEYPDANALYRELLIDVEMCACMKTSRIKQAIGSVQSFIQRALMNMEGEGLLTPVHAEEWKWKGRYRLWEANRKVFLQPENYLVSELRDDKTPFFKQLENDLLQGEVTKDSAEDAFRGYLERLQEVASLEVMAMCHDPDSQSVHVIGRTRDEPHIHYYRTWTSSPSARFSPWEKLDLDVAGDHLMLVVWNRRVHLIWGVFEDHTEPPTQISASPSVPEQEISLRLSWSERKKGKWTPKQTTSREQCLLSRTTDRTRYRARVEKFGDALGGETLRVGWLVVAGPGGVTSLGYFDFPSWGGVRFVKEVPMGTADSIIANLRPFRVPEGSAWVNERIEGASSPPGLALETSIGKVDVLGRRPEKFVLVPSVDVRDFEASRPFFFGDGPRTYFVRPSIQTILWLDPMAALDPALLAPLVATTPFQTRPFAVELVAKAGTFTVDPYIGPRRSLVDSLAVTRLVTPELMKPDLGVAGFPTGRRRQRAQFTFTAFHHPYVNHFLARLNRFGVGGLLDWRVQEQAKPVGLEPVQLMTEDDFAQRYQPLAVQRPYPVESVDFTPGAAFSPYNWELFLHAPLLIAERLMQNQRYADAIEWLRVIFDPTDTSYARGTPARFWKVKPFYEEAKAGLPPSIADLIAALAGGDPATTAAFHDQIAAYRAAPFSPYAIARYRTSAFQKAVVMKYLDALIAEGDRLFRQETIEASNEATLYYVLASEILGPRPRIVEPAASPSDGATFASLRANLDALGNALVPLENHVPEAVTNFAPTPIDAIPLGPYFCVTPNAKLIGYWDTVADRLFKIRHCMNIQGVVRELPLFEPPIDPALLVRAAAAGLDLGSVMADLGAPLPAYRFQAMSQKATELSSEARSLGQSLTGALEKQDAESLAALRANHEIVVSTMVTEVRKKAVEEAEKSYLALQRARDIAVQRQKHFDTLLATPVSSAEQRSIDALKSARTKQAIGQVADVLGAVLAMVPDVDIGVSGISSPVGKVRFGGINLSGAAKLTSTSMAGLAAMDTFEASSATTTAQKERQIEEWKYQSELAISDQKHMDIQILGAEIKWKMALQEQTNHDRQHENMIEARDRLRDKFTNAELYQWMVGQVSGTYFQAYQLAYDTAKRAQKAYAFETGDETVFIRFGYWDSLRQGLLAADRLVLDVKRMEVAYLERQRRELEITKHVSLAEVDPLELLRLRETGVCYFNVDEAIFDRDYPGHYFRRLKSVAITLPCVGGPHESVNCTLTLLRHRTRTDSSVPSPGAPSPYRENVGALEAIVTSHGQNDAGLFERGFKDERYLPFEGAGAISLWRLEVPKETNTFTRATLRDVLLHLSITARDGGEVLRAAVAGPRSEPIRAVPRDQRPRMMFRASSDFSTPFFAFLQGTGEPKAHRLVVEIPEERIPSHLRALRLAQVYFVLETKGDPGQGLEGHAVAPDSSETARAALRKGEPVAGLFGLQVPGGAGFGTWILVLDRVPAALLRADGSLDPDRLLDVVILCELTDA